MQMLTPPHPRYMNAELEGLLVKYGGLFTFDREHGEWVSSLFDAVVGRFLRHKDYAEKYLYTDKPRPIDFCFLNRPDLNAFAYASSVAPEFDFVGMNMGALPTITNVFGRILAHPNTFPDVGDPKLEVPFLYDPPSLTTNVINSGHQLVVPRCPLRARFAGELALVALSFLFFHELTHLRNGHLEFVRDFLSLSYWPEAIASNDPRWSIDALKIRQTLELNADCGAVLHSLNAAFEQKAKLVSPSKSASGDVLSAAQLLYGSSGRAAKTVSFAIYVLFRIFDHTEWRWQQQLRATHPMPPFRMSAVGPTLYEIFSQRKEYGYDAAQFVIDNTKTILEAELACGLIQGRNPDPSGILSVVQSHQDLCYTDEFASNWASIRPELEKYKRGGRLAS